MRFRIIASILALSLAGVASATPIKFTYTGTGSGGIEGTLFTSAFTITAFADTDDRESFSNGFFIDHLSASIEIAGLGTFDITSATRTFINTSVGVLGFSRAGADGADLYNGPFAGGVNWDMLTSLGTVSGTFGLLQWNVAPVNTSGGVLSFFSSEGPGTFTATTNSVPEPTTVWLMLGGLCALALMRRRRITPA